MREKLEKLGSTERHKFIGKFERYGYKSYGEKYSPTILLIDVRDSEENLLTEHLWFNCGKGFLSLGKLEKGDKVSFCARVEDYIKGRRYEKSLDYKLARPTKITLLESQTRPAMPKEKYAVIGYIMQQNEEFYKIENRTVDRWYIDKYLEWKKLGDRGNYIPAHRYQDKRGWLYEIRQHRAERSYKIFYTHDTTGIKGWAPFSYFPWHKNAEEAEKALADYARKKDFEEVLI